MRVHPHQRRIGIRPELSKQELPLKCMAIRPLNSGRIPIHLRCGYPISLTHTLSTTRSDGTVRHGCFMICKFSTVSQETLAGLSGFTWPHIREILEF